MEEKRKSYKKPKRDAIENRRKPAAGFFYVATLPAQMAKKKHEIRRALCKAAHEVSERLFPERHIDAYRIPFAYELLLKVGAYAVEHLEFKPVFWEGSARRKRLYRIDHVRVVRGDGVVGAAPE